MLRQLSEGKFHHGDNPVARWQASNAVTKEDMDGNFRFDKSRSLERIEGLVAAVMGVDRAIRHDREVPRSYAAASFA
jgi:phage terminase large subunit-like protein